MHGARVTGPRRRASGACARVHYCRRWWCVRCIIMYTVAGRWAARAIYIPSPARAIYVRGVGTVSVVVVVVVVGMVRADVDVRQNIRHRDNVVCIIIL